MTVTRYDIRNKAEEMAAEAMGDMGVEALLAKALSSYAERILDLDEKVEELEAKVTERDERIHELENELEAARNV